MNGASADAERKPSQPEAVLLRSLAQAPIAYAAVRGADHAIFFANASFRQLAGIAGAGELDRPFREAFPQRAAHLWLALLDRAALHGIATANASVPPLGSAASTETWSSTIWPVDNADGATEYCLIEVHEVPLPDHTALEVAEQLLLGALRQNELVDKAEAARQRAVFLADATRQLTESLDIELTLASTASVAVLALGADHSWCIVDVVAKDGVMRRVAIVHPDEDKQKLAAGLAATWQPEAEDFFGVPLALRIKRSQVITRVSEDMLVSAAHGAENLRLLRQLGFVSLLVVPLMIRESVIGAVTFIKGQDEPGFTETDVELAETIAARSALAIDNARLYGQAEWLRAEAEKSNHAKSEFLQRMSHELRTPLNAILGYVDLIEMGLRGPVTEMQREDLGRIKQSNHHLLAVISEILDYTRLSSGGLSYKITEVRVLEVVNRALEILQSLIYQKQMVCKVTSCPDQAMASVDPDRLEQILVNLITNGIKHTPPGGNIFVDCEVLDDAVKIRVTDTGSGIAAENLESIFDPFMQAGPVLTRPEGGVGLGLAISRDLAAGMNGTLTVESEVGTGSCFTVTLPRAR